MHVFIIAHSFYYIILYFYNGVIILMFIYVDILLIVMAITSSVSDWTSANVSKTLSIQAAMTSKLRVYKIKCTCGGSDTYATNGVSVSDIKQGRISTLVAVITETSSLAAYKVDFDKTNSKIKLYTVGGSAGASFVELANATSIASATFEFLVLGF